MDLTVQRRLLRDDRTLGELLLEGQHFGYTLEDAVRDRKIPNETAIPAGRFEVVVNYSQRFGRQLPMLLNVPNFTAVRFHGGNGPEHTEGCILVGRRTDDERIWDCSALVADLTFKILNAASAGKVWVEVRNP